MLCDLDMTGKCSEANACGICAVLFIDITFTTSLVTITGLAGGQATWISHYHCFRLIAFFIFLRFSLTPCTSSFPLFLVLTAYGGGGSIISGVIDFV